MYFFTIFLKWNNCMYFLRRFITFFWYQALSKRIIYSKRRFLKKKFLTKAPFKLLFALDRLKWPWAYSHLKVQVTLDLFYISISLLRRKCNLGGTSKTEDLCGKDHWYNVSVTFKQLRKILKITLNFILVFVIHIIKIYLKIVSIIIHSLHVQILCIKFSNHINSTQNEYINQNWYDSEKDK